MSPRVASRQDLQAEAPQERQTGPSAVRRSRRVLPRVASGNRRRGSGARIGNRDVDDLGTELGYEVTWGELEIHPSRAPADRDDRRLEQPAPGDPRPGV